MKEFEATITMTLLINAKNEEEAEQRAEVVAEAFMDGVIRINKPWTQLDGMEHEVRVEELD